MFLVVIYKIVRAAKAWLVFQIAILNIKQNNYVPFNTTHQVGIFALNTTREPVKAEAHFICPELVTFI